MTKPFFTSEDFDCNCPRDELSKGNKAAYELLLKKDFRPGHYDWCSAWDAADMAEAKVAPLIAENERLRDENRKILKELNATTQGRENAYKEQDKLTEQNRIMKEALEFYSRLIDPLRFGVNPFSDTAREALAKCKELESRDG